MNTTSKGAVDKVTYYRDGGVWCYAAWIEGEYDHSDPVDAADGGATEADVRAMLCETWPAARIVRVTDA